jgi:membrane fusion protein, multidrug efflux system
MSSQHEQREPKGVLWTSTSAAPSDPSHSVHSLRRRWLWLALGVGLIGCMAWISASRGRALKPQAPGAALVVAEPLRIAEVPQVVEAIGAAQPWRSVSIRPQIAGRLVESPVHEGADVRRGQLLAAIDPALFEAALIQAQGALERDQALLDDARINLGRYKVLSKNNLVAGMTIAGQAALVKQYEGLVRIDQGAVAAARVNLGYTKILAPFDGKLGVRNVDPGNLVGPNDVNGILILNQLSPMAVTFGIPQGEFQRLVEASNRFVKPLDVEALSQDTGELLARGRLSIADNHVDATSGTVQLKAQFDNADERLWPGQLLNVRVTLGLLHEAKTIPTRAVGTGPNGMFVYLVQDGKARLTPVHVKGTFNDQSVVEGTLKAGDEIVTDGQMGLRPDVPVRIQSVTPSTTR